MARLLQLVPRFTEKVATLITQKNTEQVSENYNCRKYGAEAGIGNRVEKERDRFNGELRLTLHTQERRRRRERERNTENSIQRMLNLYVCSVYIRVFNEHVLYKS